MGTPAIHEYGAWPSPLSASEVYRGSVNRLAPRATGGTAYWLEARPGDAGRLTLVRDRGNGPEDVSLPGHNVRTRFHEYGGGEHAATRLPDGRDLVLYVAFGTQQVWRVADGEEPRPITPASEGAVRYAGFLIDLRRGAVLALREDQRDASVEPVTSLVRLDLDGPNDDFGLELVAGRRRPVGGPEEPADVSSPPDFVLDPVLSPDGTRLAWLSWNHPNMAWDGTWLRVARLDEAGTSLRDEIVVAGGLDEAIEQPRWLDPERLLFLSDRTGWSNFHEASLAGSEPAVRVVTEVEVEFGLPRWVPRMSSYDLLPDGRVVTTVAVEGSLRPALLDLGTGRYSVVPSEATYVREAHALDARRVLALVARPTAAADVVVLDLDTGAVDPLVPSDTPHADLASPPEFVEWPVGGTSGGETANGFLYAPLNPAATAPPGTRPPLIVTLHGGPTAAATPGYTAERTFWTSRGFAVLDVNYAGSVGFGRAYRQRLEGAWGVAEVDDCVAAVRHLAETGRIDPAKALIRGGSAGGFTTLAALTSSDVFAAGCSLFGISDLGALARDTHKLESRYLWRLVAPWPEGEEVYAARSPLNRLDGLRTPLILLQGSDDRVVPPVQAELLADALREKGLPVALVMFEGEGHGFRDPENKTRALEAELSFYTQVLGLPHPEDLAPVVVENLS